MTPVTLALKDSDSRNATKSNDHLADALNEEASRWLADFLTIGNLSKTLLETKLHLS